MSLESAFAAALARLLPLGQPPHLALAVSGGADSTALAHLAKVYCEVRGGRVLALIVDHGLRPESADEAYLVAERLRASGIASQVLSLALSKGAAMQERARAARYQALAAAASAAGFVYLALGHHLADQKETVAMRRRHGLAGLEGMAAWTARDQVVLVRPLLNVQPALLRDFLSARGIAWVDDPSNQLRQFERVRIRQDQAGQPPIGAVARQEREREIADFLAHHATLHQEGYAVLATDSLPAAALGALLRTIAGRHYAPRQAALHQLAGALRPATLGGVRITKAGRLGEGWLFAREPAACAPPVTAIAQARWDNRFELSAPVSSGLRLGALGADARLFRRHSHLPNLVLQTLPALRDVAECIVFPAPVRFVPSMPMTQHPFYA